MRSDTKLVYVGADLHSIRRTCSGETILKLKRDMERKGATYKKLAEKVLREGVKLRAITAEVILKVKNLREITEAKELVAALRQQREMQVATTAVRLRKG